MTPPQHGEFVTLRALRGEDLDTWLRQYCPEGRPPQWWNSILEFSESDIIARLYRGEAIEGDDFRFALSVLQWSERSSMDVGHVGHWLLRLAQLASRSDIPTSELPHELTPDGSAHYAISIIPLSMEQAITLAQRRNIALLNEDPAIISDQELLSVQHCELIISTLAEIRERILDEELGTKIARWLAVYDEMAPRRT